MWSYYRESTECYAYLADVPDMAQEYPISGINPDKNRTFEMDIAISSAVARSEWFRRGWTLQELVAPNDVLFYTSNWKFLCSKKGLARLLSIFIGIEYDYLMSPDRAKEASIAMRMSWASRRKTTRPQDVAYCLLGLFDVNMPMLYGEGAKAFMRLQKKIVKKYDDESIFAWTNSGESNFRWTKNEDEDEDDDSEDNDDSDGSGSHNYNNGSDDAGRDEDNDNSVKKFSGMLASSPAPFAQSGDIVVLDVPPEQRLQYQITNKGLELRIPSSLYGAVSPEANNATNANLVERQISHEYRWSRRDSVGSSYSDSEPGNRYAHSITKVPNDKFWKQFQLACGFSQRTHRRNGAEAVRPEQNVIGLTLTRTEQGWKRVGLHELDTWNVFVKRDEFL